MPRIFQLLHIAGLCFNNDPGETFRRSVLFDPLLNRVQEDRMKGLRPDIVVVSGDVAYNGIKGEYELARAFLDDLLDELRLGKERLFVVPGKHDVNLGKYRPQDIPHYESVEELNAELEYEEYRDDLLKGMGEYFDFVRNYLPHLNALQSNLVPFVNIFEHGSCEKRIALVGLNSAWMCRRSRGERGIAIGEYQIKMAMDELKSKGDADLRIALFHHPLDSLWAPDRIVCKTYLEKAVVMCSYIHESQSGYLFDFDSRCYQFASGRAFRGSGSVQPGRFHYVTFDWDSQEILLEARNYVNDRRRWEIDTATGDDGTKVIPMLGQRREIDTAKGVAGTERAKQEILGSGTSYEDLVTPIKPLVQAVLDESLTAEARYNALQDLKEMGGPKAIDTLKRCVNSEDKTLARLAFEALESLDAASEAEKPDDEEMRSRISVSELSDRTVHVPAGPFLFGSREDEALARNDEKPQRAINLLDYHIDEFPVTNEQYCVFLNATLPGEDTLREWIDLEGEFMRERCRIRRRRGKYWCEKGYERHPVIYVSWYGAKQYAEWRGKRLPTEEEWEKAARGTEGAIYPWGDEFDKARCNTKESGINSTSAVDRFPKGKSPYGCYDMAGNVWEWTSSFFNDEENRMAVRGGSWLLNQALARCAARVKTLPYDWYLSLGFRCVGDKE